MDALVRSAWLAHAGSGRAADAALDSLVSRYTEPPRRYHGLSHLERVVTDTLALLGQHPVPDPSAVVLAAYFHDAVYTPTSATNEADSATLARRVLAELGHSPDRIDEVARLVRATADHQADDPAAAVLLDADLAVLGAGPAAYETYVRGVRAEYAHVDEAGWRAGRPVVLRRLLALERIYRTTTFAAREPRARANLGAELSGLG